MGEVLPKSLLASPERHERAAFDDRSGGERSIERDSSAQAVASQPWLGYPIRVGMAKKKILVEDGIHFRPRNDGGSIQFLHFATGEISTIAKMASGSFHISPDRRSILYTKTERVGGDVMLVENFQ